MIILCKYLKYYIYRIKITVKTVKTQMAALILDHEAVDEGNTVKLAA
jgi:hypothetical protein